MNTPDSSLDRSKKKADMLVKGGKLEEARKHYYAICNSNPSDTDSWLTLARLSRQLGAHSDAEYCAKQIISVSPGSASGYLEYGAALQCMGRLKEAIRSYKKALELNPYYTEAYYLLGGTSLELGATDEAITYYRKTLELDPEHIEALNNLSAIYTDQGNVQSSIELLERALRLKPDGYHMQINLARSHLHSGDAGKALNILKYVTKLYPDSQDAHSKYLLCLNYLPHQDPEYTYREHVRWAKAHTTDIKHYPRPSCYPDENRKLRIGYVSPDLKSHSVACFIEPILSNHDKSRFSITCFSDVSIPDEISIRLESFCDTWHQTHKMSNSKLAELIHSKQIDILVDLAGHTANNRLGMFAQQPAPIQIGYLGYPNTTGIKEISYRITDTIADPEVISDRYYTEKLVRLPHGFLCYLPPKQSPNITWPRNRTSNNITFGSFNNLAKITGEVVSVWSSILKAVPSSRLLIKSIATSDPYTRARLTSLFKKSGIKASRLILTGYIREKTGHLALYNNIDIALDTFPYNGTTTTCEALWMGTPVVTLTSNTHASRVGASLLSRLSLNDLVTCTEDEYILTATSLAESEIKLMKYGKALREIMRTSTLCDAKLMATDIESAYSGLWEQHCKGN